MIRNVFSKLDQWKVYSIPLLRVVVGVVFVMHGWQKVFVYGLDGVSGMMGQLGIPLPELSAAMAMGTELLGGIALIIGLGTRFASVGLAFTMVVALVTAHSSGGFFLPNGAEYVLTLLAAILAILLNGAGPLSIDSLIGNRRNS